MPIRFEIYRDGTRLDSFTPSGASVIGPESVPVPGEVRFEDGLLIVNRIEQPAGVAMLWDAGSVGSYHLETCRLPPRDKPFVLNLEMARNRLMKLIQKQEDWNLFDFPKAEKLSQQFRDAQSLLAEALGALGDNPAAARLGDRALQQAIDVSEQMSLFHADLLLNRRRANGALPKHLLGGKIDWSVQNQRYRDAACEHLDFAVLPMSWRQIQPEEDSFNTEKIDEWVELLTRRRIPIVAGPLVDLSEDAVPDWAYIWEHDFDTLRDLAYEFTRKVVSRYRKHVSAWIVTSGLHCGNSFNLVFEQMIELTRLLAAEVKNLQPQGRVLIGVRHPYGEYHANNQQPGVPPMLYAEMIAQSGVNFDGFSVDIVHGVPTPGLFTRDLFQISSMLDRFSTIGKPVFVTGAGVPGRNLPDPQDRSEGALDPAGAGQWRGEWSPQRQAQWMDDVYKIALSKPYVECIAWESLADLSPALPAGGLLDDSLKPKPVHAKLQEWREAHQKAFKR